MTGRLEHARQALIIDVLRFQVRARAPAQFGGIERAALLERIEHDDAFVERQAHEEMAGERHALQRNAEPPRQFHLHDGERNRIAQAAIEHVVQVAVTRIVIVLIVAAETEFVEEEVVERTQLCGRRSSDRRPCAGGDCTGADAPRSRRPQALDIRLGQSARLRQTAEFLHPSRYADAAKDRSCLFLHGQRRHES